MIPLTDEENKSYEKPKVCYICKNEFGTDDDSKKNYKVRDHCICIHDICNLRYKVPKEVLVSSIS